MVRKTDIEELMLREVRRGAASVLDAVPRLNPGWTRPIEHRPLAEFFGDVAQGRQRRMSYSSYPQSGKTETVASGLGWLMVHVPGIRILVCSYTGDVAEKRISARVQSHVTHGYGIPLDGKMTALGHWVASNGSSLHAAGVDGAIESWGFDVMVIDDPYKNREHANSATERANLERFVSSVIAGRVQERTSILLLMHRWHVADLVATLGWQHHNLPCMTVDAAGQLVSTVPWRWSSAAKLQEHFRETRVSPLDVSGIWFGEPRGSTGSVFTAPETYYDRKHVETLLARGLLRIAIACDPAHTAKARSNQSVITVGGFYGAGIGATLYVLDAIFLRVEAPELLARLCEEQKKWRCVVGIEAVGGAITLPQLLQRAAPPGLKVYPLRASKDKLARSIPLQAAWSRGEVQFPPDAAWLHEALAETAAFSGTAADRSDDFVDSLVHLHGLNACAAHAELLARRRRDLARALPFG